jgi:hypothetical protein
VVPAGAKPHATDLWNQSGGHDQLSFLGGTGVSFLAGRHDHGRHLGCSAHLTLNAGEPASHPVKQGRTDALPNRAEAGTEVIRQRYEHGSTVITTHRAFKQWPEVFNNDSTPTTAILDRLVHRAYKIRLNRESMRKHAACLTDDPARA